jgi:hypothetical protein
VIGAGNELRRVPGVTDGAELHEIGVTGKVEPMRFDRRRRRHEHGAQANPVARGHHGIEGGHADPDLHRGRSAFEALDDRSPEREALAVDAILDQQDCRLDLVGTAPLQRRRCHEFRADGRDREAQQDRAHGEPGRHLHQGPALRAEPPARGQRSGQDE